MASRSPATIHHVALGDHLRRYQNLGETGPKLKVLSELDVTQIILHNTMERPLERGEKLDDLVSKPKALRTPSKARKPRGDRTWAVQSREDSLRRPRAEMSRSFTSELQPLGKQIHRERPAWGHSQFSLWSSREELSNRGRALGLENMQISMSSNFCKDPLRPPKYIIGTNETIN